MATDTGYTITKIKLSTISKSDVLEQLFGIRDRCLASEDITNGMVPMGNEPPCRDGPDLIVAPHPGAKFPSAELASDLSKASNDLIHVGALGWVFLVHVIDKRLHGLEAIVFLARRSQNFI